MTLTWITNVSFVTIFFKALNRFSPQGLFNSFSWPMTLLDIDKKESMIVCAPTSSGKTVLSSYVSVIGGQVLFVVPSEPLAW